MKLAIIGLFAVCSVNAMDCERMGDIALDAALLARDGVAVNEIVKAFPLDTLEHKISRATIEVAHKKALKTKFTAEQIAESIAKQCFVDLPHQC